MSDRGRAEIYLIIGAAAVVCAGVLVGVVRQRSAGLLYTARTTMMETTASVAACPVKKNTLGYVVTLATSQRVKIAAAATMADLGVKTPADELLSHTRVHVVSGTNVIAVETTCEDPLEAKIAADVVAAQIKKAFANGVVKELQNKVDMLDHRARSAERHLDERYAVLGNCRESLSNAGDVAKAEADAEVAADAYTEAQTHYNKAKLDLDRAKHTVYLRTLEPAYVYPAKRRFIF